MIYTNLKFVSANEHGMFESSLLKSSIVGRIYDAVLAEDVDNGVAIKIGDATGDGLQTRNATVAAIGDKIAVVGTPALVKSAFTNLQAQPYNFYNVAGKPVKAYEVLDDAKEVFGVASYQFTGDAVPKVGQYVVVDGNGMWTAQNDEPGETYGFIGKVHSFAVGTYYTMVRIEVVQNVQK